MARGLLCTSYVRHTSQLFELTSSDDGPIPEALDPKISRKYRVERLVAEGGMGRVLEATRRRDSCRVALKILSPKLAHDERSRRHMLREAHALALVAHPLIVELHEYGQSSSALPYLALEWLEGRTMHAMIVQDGPPVLLRVARLFLQLLEALEVVHSRGVIHGDLKPENVMLVRDREGCERIRLVDFGVSSVLAENWHTPGEVCGTPGYLAPEIMMGKPPTPSSDLYAAGIVLYELLTGYQPWVPGTLAGLVRQQAYDPPPRPSEMRAGAGGALDAVVTRALAAKPQDRFDGTASLRDAFLAALPASVRAALDAGPPVVLRLRGPRARALSAVPSVVDAAATGRWRPAAIGARRTKTWQPGAVAKIMRS